jgi:hypothetical protein
MMFWRNGPANVSAVARLPRCLDLDILKLRRYPATTRGRKGGRKPVITAEKLKRAREIIGKGLTVREAEMRLKVGKTALYDALRH